MESDRACFFAEKSLFFVFKHKGMFMVEMWCPHNIGTYKEHFIVLVEEPFGCNAAQTSVYWKYEFAKVLLKHQMYICFKIPAYSTKSSA